MKKKEFGAAFLTLGYPAFLVWKEEEVNKAIRLVG